MRYLLHTRRLPAYSLTLTSDRSPALEGPETTKAPAVLLPDSARAAAATAEADGRRIPRITLGRTLAIFTRARVRLSAFQAPQRFHSFSPSNVSALPL